MDGIRRRLWLGSGLAAGALLWRAAATAQDRVVDVEIRDHRFIPDRLSVAVGTTVRWTNHERRTSHSVLFTGAAAQESDRLFPGDHWQRRFTERGSYPYTCGPHPEMKGLVVVE